MKSLLLLSVVLLISGCAVGGGASVYRSTKTSNNGVVTEETEKGRTLPFIAWGDARQAMSKERVANTKSGNSIGLTGVEQETSATNVAPVINSAGGLIGEAAKQFLKP